MALNPPAIADAYRRVVVTGTGTPGTAVSKEVGGQLNLDAGFGISLVTDEANNKVTIVNTGNGTGALTTITENNNSGTYYPIFTRNPPGTQTFSAGASDFVSGDILAAVAEVRITGTTNDPFGVSAPLRAALVGIIESETFSLIRVSNSAVVNFTATGPATYSTINGYWTIPVTAAPGVTDTFVSITIASGAGELNPITGTYQMDTMYLDQTTTPLTYNPSLGLMTVNQLSVVDSLATTGHLTVEGVTSTGATGTGRFVFDNSPTLITPVLGVATATSINKMAITAPATGSTLAVEEGKTFTVKKSITIDGTDTTTITLPATTGTVALDNQQFYIGTTQVAINRASASLSLTGISIDGNAGTVTNGVYTTGSYSDPSWLTISATKVGLGNVTNESKATMFSSPTFTGTVSGVTATMVGLGNVTNESKATMFSSPTFTGTVSGVTATMVGLGNVTNESKATMFTDPTFTGTVAGVTSSMVGLGNVENTALSTSTFNIGTTSIQYNRASASQTLTGVSIDGNAGTVTNGFYTSSSFNLGTTSVAVNRASATQSLTGVNIDGSAGSVPASGITGTTLASGVTGSSLTSVGTLTSLSVTNNISTVSGMFSAPLATKTSTSAGTAGQVAWDANYIYICTATNTWKRVALTAGVF
jgi:hypothetical protein